MQLRSKQLITIFGGVCFSLGVYGGDTEIVNRFSLYCGVPETAFLFTDQTSGLDIWEDVSISHVDLHKFDRKLVIKQIQALYRAKYEPLVVIPISHFSYKGIYRLAYRLLIGEIEFSGEVDWCINFVVLNKYVQQEAMEKGMKSDVTEPGG